MILSPAETASLRAVFPLKPRQFLCIQALRDLAEVHEADRARGQKSAFEPYLEPVRVRVRDSLWVLCEEKTFALVSRIKTLESASEKVETGRFKSWIEIDDLVAMTVVVPTLAQESVAIDFLQSVFDQIDLRARGSTSKAPDIFRFDSTRFIGRLRSSDESSRGPMHNVPFEVQIRSAFEHAWSVTTHALTFKSADVSWSKLRLTSQLKAAVE